MSRDGWAALPRGATGLSVVVIVVFPDNTHYFCTVQAGISESGTRSADMSDVMASLYRSALDLLPYFFHLHLTSKMSVAVGTDQQAGPK